MGGRARETEERIWSRHGACASIILELIPDWGEAPCELLPSRLNNPQRPHIVPFSPILQASIHERSDGLRLVLMYSVLARLHNSVRADKYWHYLKISLVQSISSARVWYVCMWRGRCAHAHKYSEWGRFAACLSLSLSYLPCFLRICTPYKSILSHANVFTRRYLSLVNCQFAIWRDIIYRDSIFMRIKFGGFLLINATSSRVVQILKMKKKSKENKSQ